MKITDEQIEANWKLIRDLESQMSPEQLKEFRKETQWNRLYSKCLYFMIRIFKFIGV